MSLGFFFDERTKSLQKRPVSTPRWWRPELTEEDCPLETRRRKKQNHEHKDKMLSDGLDDLQWSWWLRTHQNTITVNMSLRKTQFCTDIKARPQEKHYKNKIMLTRWAYPDCLWKTHHRHKLHIFMLKTYLNFTFHNAANHKHLSTKCTILF